MPIGAIRGSFRPHARYEFVPTGGVNLDTVSEFLAAGCCAVGVGSELVDAKLIGAGKFDELTERAQQYKQKVLDYQASL